MRTAADQIEEEIPENEDFEKVIVGPFDSLADIDAAMRRLMRSGSDALPHPGQGATAERWRNLAIVSSHDLSFAKIFESHTDALAILNELGHSPTLGNLLAVWAAENPGLPLTFDPTTSRLNGRKQWCSGASVVDEALVTAKTKNGGSVLVRVEMNQPEVKINPSEWANPGIAAAETTSVNFFEAVGTQVGDENAYIERPGFWQGAAGIAAVWYGGAVGVASVLADTEKVSSDPHAASHLGAIHSQLEAARALLVRTAEWIDENSATSAMLPARTLRAAVESAATETLQRTGRALGAAALCTRPEHARRVADLEIFLRQSHAERDLAALGEAAAKKKWSRFW